MNPNSTTHYQRLTVAEARALPLRALQEHVFWVGWKRIWDGVRRVEEPGFPWFPMHMERSALIDAIGDWASVFDPEGGHELPPVNIVKARPQLTTLGMVSLVIHVAGANAEDLDRGTAAATKVLTDAGTDPVTALRAWGSREMSFDGEPDTDGEMTERAWELAEAWDEASQVALEACCGERTRSPSDYRRLEVLSDDDVEIRQLLVDLGGIPLEAPAETLKTPVAV